MILFLPFVDSFYEPAQMAESYEGLLRRIP